MLSCFGMKRSGYRFCLSPRENLRRKEADLVVADRLVQSKKRHNLFHGNALGKIARLVHVAASGKSNVI